MGSAQNLFFFLFSFFHSFFLSLVELSWVFRGMTLFVFFHSFLELHGYYWRDARKNERRPIFSFFFVLVLFFLCGSRKLWEDTDGVKKEEKKEKVFLLRDLCDFLRISLPLHRFCFASTTPWIPCRSLFFLRM